MATPIKIYSWNVNGIRAVHNKALFEPFMAEHQPDILCLQETKAQQEQSLVHIPGYTEYWNSAEKKGYSGTAIFTNIQPIAVIKGLPRDIIDKYGVAGDAYGNPNTEGRVLAAEFDEFYVVTVYTPNAKDNLARIPLREQWDPAFLAYCQLLEKTKPVIFCGDLNVAHTEDDLARPKPNVGRKGFTAEERAGFQAFVDAGYTDTFRATHDGNGFYTWWSNFGGARARNVGWRIDYVLASDTMISHVTDAAIHPSVMGSDHCPVSITIKL